MSRRPNLVLSDWSDLDQPIPPPSPAQVRAARLFVCASAVDAADAAALLDALGIGAVA